MAAVLIDGGYLQRVLRDLYGTPRLDYARLSEWAAEGFDLFRTYYYDCLPYLDNPPTNDQLRRFASKEGFLKALDRLDRYAVRLGRLERRGIDADGQPIFLQKRIDLQIGLDVASLIASDTVSMIVLVAGDSDMIPAVQLARERNLLVRLVVPPRQGHIAGVTYHQDLWDMVDERKPLNADAITRLARTA